MLSTWIALTVLEGFRERLKYSQGSLLGRLSGLPRSFWGMQVAHFGIAMGVAGITMVANYQTERDVKMMPGEHVELAGYSFTFNNVRQVPGPNYLAARGEIEVTKDGSRVALLNPEKRIYNATGTAMTEAAISPNFFRDIYVSLGEQLEGGAWAVRVYHKPFINWLWLGGGLLVLGGFLAATDRRYRITMRKTAAVSSALAQGARA